MPTSNDIFEQMLASGVFFWDVSERRNLIVSENFRDFLGLASCSVSLADLANVLTEANYELIAHAVHHHQTHWFVSLRKGGKLMGLAFDRQTRYTAPDGVVHASGTARVAERAATGVAAFVAEDQASSVGSNPSPVTYEGNSMLYDQINALLAAFRAQVPIGLHVVVLERLDVQEFSCVSTLENASRSSSSYGLRVGSRFTSPLFAHVSERHGVKVVRDLSDYMDDFDSDMQFFKGHGYRSGMSVSVRDSVSDTSWGILAALADHPKVWTDSDKQWLAQLANSLGILLSQSATSSRLSGLLQFVSLACQTGGVFVWRVDVLSGRRFVLSDEGAEEEVDYNLLVHRKDMVRYDEAYRRLLNGVSDKFSMRLRLKRDPDSECLWYDINLRVAELSPEGHAVTIVGAARDVNDVVLREVEERQQREFRDQIYDNMPAVITFFDVQGQMTFANGFAADTFGVRRKEDLYVLNFFKHDFLSEEQKMTVRMNDVCNFSVRYDFRGAAERGIIPTRKTDVGSYAVRVSKVFSAGKMSGYMALIVDQTLVSAQKKKIDIFNSFFQEIGRFAKIGVRHFGSDGFASDQWCANLAIDENEVLDPAVFFVPSTVENEDAEVLRDEFTRLEKSESDSFQMEIRVKRDDDVAWVSMHFMRDLASGLITAISVDVSERKREGATLVRAREKAEKADVLKSQFLNNISHEIRTPLNAIVGFSELIAQTVSDPDLLRYAGLVRKNNEQLLRLIDGVIEMSQIQSGSREVSRSVVSIGQLLDDLCEAKAADAPDGVAFKCECPDGQAAARVYVDARSVVVVLGHLVANAFDNTTDGSVKVWVETSDEEISFHVSDTGRGIPQEAIASIFDTFFKVDNFNAGSGLGLSISRSLAVQMGGDIHVESVEGRGAHFWLSLPVIEAPDRDAELESSETDIALLSKDEALMMSLSRAFPHCDVSRCDSFSLTAIWLEKHPLLTIIDARACHEVADILVGNIRSRGDLFRIVVVTGPLVPIPDALFFSAGADAVVAAADTDAIIDSVARFIPTR